jgi:hypothetical protein
MKYVKEHRNQFQGINSAGYIGWRKGFLGIDCCAGILEQSMGARNRGGTMLSVASPPDCYKFQHWAP